MLEHAQPHSHPKVVHSRREGRRNHARLAAFAVLLGVGICQAGELGDLEKSATTKDGGSSKGESSTHASRDPNAIDTLFGNLFFGIFKGIGTVFYEGGRRSCVRSSPPRDTPDDSLLRHAGAPDIPWLRLDATTGNFSSGVLGYHGSVQVGWGAFAFQAQGWNLEEPGATPSKMEIRSYHAMLRMAPAPQFEVDLGLGGTRMTGSSTHDGFSLTIPVSIAPTNRVALRWTPCWSWLGGHILSDQDLSLWLTFPYVSIHGGIRWLGAGDVEFVGPQAGSSFAL